MLCIPMRRVLASALATQGAAKLAAAPANTVRRVISPLMVFGPPLEAIAVVDFCDERLFF
jgi:hypothetical protein